ncbi:MAG: YecH family protein [Oceanipulchritudo sp.]
MESIHSEEVHAHRVMETLLLGGQTYSREGLEAAIREQFGSGARFETCSAKGMTAEELVRFLMDRGKLAGTANSLGFAAAGTCSD